MRLPVQRGNLGRSPPNKSLWAKYISPEMAHPFAQGAHPGARREGPESRRDVAQGQAAAIGDGGDQGAQEPAVPCCVPGVPASAKAWRDRSGSRRPSVAAFGPGMRRAALALAALPPLALDQGQHPLVLLLQPDQVVQRAQGDEDGGLRL